MRFPFCQWIQWEGGFVLYLRALRILAVVVFMQSALAAPLLPGHLPVGARRPLEAGETVTLSPSRTFDKPTFDAASRFFSQECKATVLGVSNNFYHLRLEATADSKAHEAWIYRSELEVRSQAARPQGDALPADLSRGKAPRLPAAGDTLNLLSPVLFKKADLLGEQEMLMGRHTLTVKSPENAQGFLQVRTSDGRSGWVHRTELAEERRRPR